MWRSQTALKHDQKTELGQSTKITILIIIGMTAVSGPVSVVTAAARHPIMASVRVDPSQQKHDLAEKYLNTE